ncbi:MAG TPA: hypothetical protein VFI39_10895 [Gemmatimonadales bacterium]|nr:hypothetical protein [Gemmatimonadales bacterium]
MPTDERGDMRSYWLKIAAKALMIFVIGLIGIQAFRRIQQRVHGLVNGSADVTIPLLGIVPLSIGNERLGAIRELEIHRDAPKHVSGFTVVARLDDSVDADRFDDCNFTLRDPTRINDKSMFVCLDSIPAGMRPFGTLQLSDSQDDSASVRPLLLTEQDINDLQQTYHDNATPNIDSLDAVAESIRAAAQRTGDSIGRVMRARYRKESTGTVYRPTRPDPPPSPTPSPKPKASSKP